MGAKQHKIYIEKADDPLTQLMSNSQKSTQHLSNLLARFTGAIKFQKQIKVYIRGKQIWITQSIVKLFCHQSFNQKVLEYYHYLRKYIKKLLQKKAMIFITHDQWRLCYGLSQFIMLCCDQNIKTFMNQPVRMMHVRKEDIYGKIQKLLQSKTTQICTFQALISPIDKAQIVKQFRDFMYFSVGMKNKLISDFSSTFTMIYAVVQSLLSLTMKLQKDFNLRQAFKRNIYTATYAIGLGVQYIHPATINLAVRMILKIIKVQQKSIQEPIKINSIPSHNFTQIPLLTCTNIYETIATYLIYILCFKNEELNLQPIVKLLTKVSIIFRPKNKQITYFLEKLCKSQCIQKGNIAKIIKRFQQSGLKKTELIQKFLNANSDSFQQKSDKFLQFTQNNLRSVQVEAQSGNTKRQQLQQDDATYQKQIQNIYHKILIKKFMPQIDIQQLDQPKLQIQSKKSAMVLQMKEPDQVSSQKQIQRHIVNIKSRQIAIEEYTQDG